MFYAPVGLLYFHGNGKFNIYLLGKQNEVVVVGHLSNASKYFTKILDFVCF